MRFAPLAALGLLLLTGCATTARDASIRAPAASIRAQQAASIRAPQEDARDVLIRSARSMLGQPYRFGGDAPGGFDCSGLVRYAAQAAGIVVPRTAHEQLKAGRAISRRELAPGDLVFMHLQHKVLHVAIVIDRTRFIHAPSTGGVVRIDSLTAVPYATGFVGARRIALASIR